MSRANYLILRPNWRSRRTEKKQEG